MPVPESITNLINEKQVWDLCIPKQPPSEPDFYTKARYQMHALMANVFNVCTREEEDKDKVELVCHERPHVTRTEEKYLFYRLTAPYTVSTFGSILHYLITSGEASPITTIDEWIQLCVIVYNVLDPRSHPESFPLITEEEVLDIVSDDGMFNPVNIGNPLHTAQITGVWE